MAGNHHLDADAARAALSEVIDDLAIQSRMLGTVIQELQADADKIFALRSADSRLLFAAGMLTNRIRTDLESGINLIRTISETVADYKAKV